MSTCSASALQQPMPPTNGFGKSKTQQRKLIKKQLRPELGKTSVRNPIFFIGDSKSGSQRQALQESTLL
jgi:hypothetical protein